MVSAICDKTTIWLHPFSINISKIYQKERDIIRLDMQIQGLVQLVCHKRMLFLILV